MVRIRSRIHQHFNEKIMKELYAVCRNSVISDNNLKVSAMIDILQKHNIDFVELGPGTNRLAVLIDNYVFKIALDKWGLQDNLNEFTVSQELQPYVVKTYETNELFSVCEYVTVISREEFEDNKDALRSILAVLADGYLLGDVGTVNKNFTNWGYRDNGDLVVLDFAYIYRVQGDELLCSQDQSILEYDENFHNLRCPSCNKKYSFMDLRRKITMEQEKHENMVAKQFAYKLTEAVQEVKDQYQDAEADESSRLPSSYNKPSEPTKEETYMPKDEGLNIDTEHQEEDYLETMKMLKSMNKGKGLVKPQPELRGNKQPIPYYDDNEMSDDDTATILGADVSDDNRTATTILEINKESETEKSQIRIISQTPITPIGDTDGDIETKAEEILEQAQEKVIDTAVEIEGLNFDMPGVKVHLPTDKGFDMTNSDVVGINSEQEEVVVENETEEETEEVVEAVVVEEEYVTPSVKLEVTDAVVITEDVVAEVVGVEITEEVKDTPMITTPSMIMPIDKPEDSEEEDMYRNIMENDNDPLPMTQEEEMTEVEYKNTVQVNDHISIENTIKVQVEESEADKLRRSLTGNLPVDNGIDEEKVEALAEEYSHLEEQADEQAEEDIRRGRSGNKNWR